LKPEIDGISSIAHEFGDSLSFASLGNGALIKKQTNSNYESLKIELTI